MTPKSVIQDGEVNPYGDIICNHIKRNNLKISNFNSCELVDLLSDMIINTKEYRYGPSPDPEHLVNIRSIIRDSIMDNQPIQVLVPWGSIKSDFSGNIDIAELSAFQTLSLLYDQVKSVYEPGIIFNIRVEDVSGLHLFQLDKAPRLEYSMNWYSNSLALLARVLDPGAWFLIVKQEMNMPNSKDFWKTADNLMPIFLDYLIATEGILTDDGFNEPYLIKHHEKEWGNLISVGWNGFINRTQRDHYLSAYSKLYPNLPKEKYLERLAIYFAGSLTRFKLGMTGKPKYGRCIQLSFVPPIPGMPYGYNHSYVYYRTLPYSQARTHICPWRAKGYLKIEGNKVTSKICSVNDEYPINHLVKAHTILEGEYGSRATLSTDYLLIS